MTASSGSTEVASPRWGKLSGVFTTRRALWAVIVLSYLPIVWPHLRRLWQSENYRFFPVILIGFAVLLWVRIREMPPRRRLRRPVSQLPQTLWLVAALVLLALAVLLWSTWIAAVSAVVAARAVLLKLGAPQGKRFLSVWLLLWLLIPLPLGWDVRLTFWLQGLTSQWGSCLLDFLRVPHLITGHVVQMPGYQVLVEDACSGVRSLISLCSITAMFVLWFRRPFVHSVLMLAAAVFWAIVVNAVRVATVVYCFVMADTNISTGWPSHALDFGLFAAALGLLLCTDRMLIFLLLPIPEMRLPSWDEESDEGEEEDDELDDDDEDEAAEDDVEHLKERARIMALPVLATLFGVLGVIQLATIYGPGRTLTVVADRTEQLASTLDERTLPREQSGFRQTAFDKKTREAGSDLGRHSATWTYRRGTVEAVVACDFPFVGWHALEQSYQAQGWDVVERDIVVPPSDQDPSQAGLVQVVLRRADGIKGLLLFSLFDSEGRPLEPPGVAGLSASSWTRAIKDRVSRRLTQFGLELASYQVSLLLTGETAVNRDEQTRAMEVFLRSRERVAGSE